MPITILRQEGRFIWLPADLMETGQLSPGQTAVVHFGQLQTTAKLLRSPHPRHVYVGHETAHLLCLPDSPLHVRITEKNHIRLGPVIGLLSNWRVPMFTSFLAAAHKKGAIFYFFRPQDVLWREKKVIATVIEQVNYQQQKVAWKRLKLPLPDVVYERILNRQSEKRKDVQQCLQNLKRMEIPIFNQGFYDKWTIYQRLESIEALRPHLPETALAYPANIASFLEKYHSVYIKPIHGSLGLGIVRAHQLARGAVQCDFQRYGTVHSRIIPSIYHLFREYAVSPARYLVQPAIPLIQYRESPVDFRLHLHRDGLGQWQVVAVGAKVAHHRRSITTHVRTGGFFMPAEVVLQAAFGDKSGAILDSLRRTAILFAEEVAQREKGPIGELGLDMGIDTDGHPWLFEINAKPGRHIFHNRWLKQAARESARSIVDYAAYLSGFVTQQRGGTTWDQQPKADRSSAF